MTSQEQQPSKQTLQKEEAHPRRLVGMILWGIGVILLIILSVTIHMNPDPWPVELAFTKAIQGPHPVPCVYDKLPSSLAKSFINFFSNYNDPIPSTILLVVVAGTLLLARLWRQAITLVAGVLFATGVFIALGNLVNRPRPGMKDGICMQSMIPFHSYPSGHVIHEVIFYGFLLYVSFMPPVRNWRYRWLLIPFQLFAVLDLALIGFSRILAGEHWLFDVVGGYLAGTLCLCLLIFLFRWIESRFFAKA
jgi:membrane-associated phospholipid phosphatase